MTESNLEPLRCILAAAPDFKSPSSTLHVSEDMSIVAFRSAAPSAVSIIACPVDTFLFVDLMPNRLLEPQRLFLVWMIVMVMNKQRCH